MIGRDDVVDKKQQNQIRKRPQKRIVGNQNVVSEMRYPWFARIIGISTGGGLASCGGSLIGPDY
jgi:hypothetical protein